VSIALHWASAALVLATLGIGLGFESLERSPLEAPARFLHISLGLTVLALTALRLLWRLASPMPAAEPGMPRWQAIAARLVQLALLVLIVALPLSGWAMLSAAGRPIGWFGLVALPPLMAPDPALRHLTHEVHELLAYAVLGLVTVHVLAALKHHLIDRDGTLRRMLGAASA
jgi:cytochrome b561